MKKAILLTIVALMVCGCAAPSHIKEQAARDLTGSCLILFLNSGVGGYQYVANAATGRAAFALASDEGGQACGMATNMSSDVVDGLFLSLPSSDRVEAVAIHRCEQTKPFNVKAPCRTYARNNSIVWRNSLKKGME